MNKSSHLQRGGPLSGFLRGREKGKGRVGWRWDEIGPLTQSRPKWFLKAAGSSLRSFLMPSLIQSSRYPLPIEYLSWALSLKASYRLRLGLEAVIIKQTISVTFLYWSSLGLFPKISCTASEPSLSALRLLLKHSEGSERFGHAPCFRVPSAISGSSRTPVGRHSGSSPRPRVSSVVSRRSGLPWKPRL